MARAATVVALVAATALCVAGLMRGTWAVGGSDSSCYALMAHAFAHGMLQPTTELALAAPWPDAARTFAPAGFIPSPAEPAAASPICAPGFSLLLAPFILFGGPNGIFLVTPLAAAVLVWLTFVFTRRLAGPFAGAAAAIVVAATPVVLFQTMQPMNDITVAALWMAVLVAASSAEPRAPWLLGALTGCALLVRPNLAPSAVVVGLWLAVTSYRRGGRRFEVVRRRMIAFAIASAPFLGLLLTLNMALYGHPLQSGYGDPGDLFGLQHVMPNLVRYTRTVLETQLGLPLLGVVALLTVRPPARDVVWLALGVSASVVAVYLCYRPFDEWWYLRFLLPAIVPMTALAVVALARGAGALRDDLSGPVGKLDSFGDDSGPSRRLARLGSTATIAIIVALTVAMAVYGVDIARDRQAFDLHRLERRFHQTGATARHRLPGNAIFITVWNSGTVRFHAAKQVLLWDSLDPQALDQAVAWLTAHGFEPYIITERWEEPLFRERFAPHTALGNLDWPPRFDVEREVRIFKASDREGYMKGGGVPTEYVLQR